MERKSFKPEADASRRPSRSGTRAAADPDVVPRRQGLSDVGSIDFPVFKPRAPWWGGDLQTVRNFVTGHAVDLSGFEEQRLQFETDDQTGDRLQGVLNHPVKAARRPLLMLVHGLTGCDDSSYLRASARHFLEHGHRALRVNMRGSGPSRKTCKHHYHAGRSEDLRAVLTRLPSQLINDGIIVMGFSLGGNQTLKMLGEGGTALDPVRAAVSVSAPIDLSNASRHFLRRRNRIYHRWLLARMKADALAPGATVTDDERRAIEDARTVYDFDDRFIAPRHGFAGADDYYRRCSALCFLACIRVPTLVLHACDDPWIPCKPHHAFDWQTALMVRPLLSEGGGHVGFHGRGSPVAWHDRCARLFFDSVAGRS